MDSKKMDKILKQIQDKANKKFPDVFKEEMVNEEMVFIIDKLQKSKVPQWKKDYYIRQRPKFAEVRQVLDEELADKKDKYVMKLINEAVAKKQLPKKIKL